MHLAILMVVFLLSPAARSQMAGDSSAAQAPRVVDRIAARIEDDIILQSQVRELGAFQQLVEGKAESDDKLLNELIEQWIVEAEATSSHFPQPAQSEVDREMARLAGQFADPAKYASRVNELGLDDAGIRAMLRRQIFAERYLDYKFRPTVQVAPTDIEAYYNKELAPDLARQSQPAPPRARVEEQIREVLIQRGISDLTAKWLDDTKSRLRIEIEKPVTQP